MLSQEHAVNPFGMLGHRWFRLSTYVIGLVLAALPGRLACADDTTLFTIGPRWGFTGKAPFLGKGQKHTYYLADVAALFLLPWSWPLGESPWRLETRALTTAGLLTAAGDSALMVTAIPCLAVSGWNRFVSIDGGAGAAVFTRDRFGVQDFGGPVQIVATVGIQVTPIAHTYAGVRLQHFSDAGLYGSHSLGVDMYVVEVGYRF